MQDSTNPAAECLCGRSAIRPHCPKCGSRELYAYSKQATVIRHGGREQKLKTFRCKTCANRFTQDDWTMNCQAPPKRHYRLGKMAVQVNSLEERAQLLEHLREIQKLRDLP